MKQTSLIILTTAVAMSLAACAAEAPELGVDDAQETTGTTASAVTMTAASVRPTGPAPVIQTTLDRWQARCPKPSIAVGVIVPRATWECPTVPSGPGWYVGTPGWQFLAEGYALGLTDAQLLAASPDLTPEMVSYAQPFCAYSYEIAAGTPPANNGQSMMSLAARRVADLEAAVGPVAGPVCVMGDTPYPGSMGCPTCWSKFLLPIIVSYPAP